MSGWNCPHEVNGICLKVDGALCCPGMKGCILFGKVEFRDGVIPSPVWPAGLGPRRQPPDPQESGTGEGRDQKVSSPASTDRVVAMPEGSRPCAEGCSAYGTLAGIHGNPRR